MDADDERIAQASRAIRAMSDELKAELDRSVSSTIRSWPGPLQRLRGFTRQAPVQALAIAFLLGMIVVRR